MYVLLGRAVTEYRWGGSHNILFMRHKLLVLTVKKFLQSVYIYGSYRKIKTGVPFFLDHPVQGPSEQKPIKNWERRDRVWAYPWSAQIFWVAPSYYLRNSKGADFKFCAHIHMIDRNKSPLNILAKVAVGVLRGSLNFSGHPYIGRIAQSPLR